MIRPVSLLLVLLCGVRAGAEPTSATTGWHYDVQVQASGSTVRVAITPRGLRARRWTLSDPGALVALRLTPESTRAYRKDGSGVRPLRGGDAPLTYHVAVDTLIARRRDREDSARVGRDLVTRPGLLLLQPNAWPDEARVTATFHLPPGGRVAVPWPPEDAGGLRYRVPGGALGPFTRMAIGRWPGERLPIDGTDVDLALLDGPVRVTAAGRRQWLQTAMGTVADLYGGFPAKRLQVIAQPLVPDRGRPIVFGRASRGGGALVHVMLSGTASDAAFPGEWLTIHEMIHLGMPWTTRAARWLGEGVVSYYQEVLRARAGILSERQAWQNLHDWFERGRVSGGRLPLAVESERMTNRYAYHRVYWGGAALTLLMDLAIRRRTAGRQGFDDVMRHWRRRHGSAIRAFEAPALLRSADAWLGAPLLVPLVTPHLSSRAFPDLRGAYASLGIRVENGHVRLRHDAPRAEDRRAIMRRGGR